MSCLGQLQVQLEHTGRSSQTPLIRPGVEVVGEPTCAGAPSWLAHRLNTTLAKLRGAFLWASNKLVRLRPIHYRLAL